MMRTITHILVPTDFGPASDAALEYGITMARRFGASLHLLHVVNDPFVQGAPWGSEVYVASIPAVREARIDEASRKLAAARARVETHGIPVRTQVCFGRPANIIREVAEQEACDLIVMGTHGRTGMAHLLLGSIAEETMREANRPVLTVRGADDGVEAGSAFERDLAPTE